MTATIQRRSSLGIAKGSKRDLDIPLTFSSPSRRKKLKHKSPWVKTLLPRKFARSILLVTVLFAVAAPACFLRSSIDAMSLEKRFIGQASIDSRDKPHDKADSDMEFQVVSALAPSTCKPVQETEISYTLVTQLSYDRLWMVRQHCLRWGPDAPISVAVLVTPQDEESIDDSGSLDAENLSIVIHQKLQEMGCNGDQLTVQALKPESSETGDEAVLADYPVNYLRNVALSATRTTHAVYLDVDFWPSSDLHGVLNNDVVRQKFAEDEKAAMVIPAFSQGQCYEEGVFCQGQMNVTATPRRRSELIDSILNKMTAVFDPSNDAAHGSTLYEEWFGQQATEIIPIPCIKSNHYEPYIVFRYCQDLPPFQEQFTGYGKNKMTWMMHLRRAGWAFWQLGETFCVHYPHQMSKARRAWVVSKTEEVEQLDHARSVTDDEVDFTETRRGINDAIFVQFRRWLNEVIPDESRMPMCPDFADEDDDKLWIDQGR